MATALPPGVNLEDNGGPEIIRATSVVAVLATLALVARLAARRLKKTSLGASDYAVIVGWMTAWALNISLLFCFVSGACGTRTTLRGVADGKEGRITESWLPTLATMCADSFKLLLADEILYTITLVAVKISILLLYRSIFAGRAFAIVVNITSAFVVAWGLASILVSIFTCKPIHGLWDITIPSTCINSRDFFLGSSIPNICMDVFILSLPVRKVWQLQMPVRQKIVVSGLFLLGGFVCIASGVRLYMLLSMSKADPPWTYYGVAVWSVVEVNTAVISACLPTIRPVLQLGVPIFQSLGLSSKTSRNAVLNATSSNAVKRKDADVFYRLPDSPQGSNVASKPAKGTHVNTLGHQIDQEGGDLLVKDEVM